MIFIIGIGNILALTPPIYLYRGKPALSAAHLAVAKEAPKMAFAPKLPLFLEPSN